MQRDSSAATSKKRLALTSDTPVAYALEDITWSLQKRRASVLFLLNISFSSYCRLLLASCVGCGSWPHFATGAPDEAAHWPWRLHFLPAAVCAAVGVKAPAAALCVNCMALAYSAAAAWGSRSVVVAAAPVAPAVHQKRIGAGLAAAGVPCWGVAQHCHWAPRRVQKIDTAVHQLSPPVLPSQRMGTARGDGAHPLLPVLPTWLRAAGVLECGPTTAPTLK